MASTRSSSKSKQNTPNPSIRLIVCDEENPKVTLKPGMRFEVASVSLVDPVRLDPQKIGGRLCGGSGTCLALIDVAAPVINPAPKGQ